LDSAAVFWHEVIRLHNDIVSKKSALALTRAFLWADTFELFIAVDHRVHVKPSRPA
jgi:hypothetical protein